MKGARTFAWLSLFFAVLAFSVALVESANARHQALPPEVYNEVVVVEKRVSVYDDPVSTPIIDELVGEERFEYLERESDCLFEYLRSYVGYEITLDLVLAGGYWTEALGGACNLIGEGEW